MQSCSQSGDWEQAQDGVLASNLQIWNKHEMKLGCGIDGFYSAIEIVNKKNEWTVLSFILLIIIVLLLAFFEYEKEYDHDYVDWTDLSVLVKPLFFLG